MRIRSVLAASLAAFAWPLAAGAGESPGEAALQNIQGQWHHPDERCEDASATISVEGGRIRFDWVWEDGAKTQLEIERIESVLQDEIRTTAVQTAGDEQKDLPGHRFRYTLDGDRLTIESLSGTFEPQVVLRCALSV